MEPSATASGGASSSSLSLVSRAKTALHSAAARAEKVLTDIKADMKNDRDGDGQAKRELRKMEDRVSSAADCSCGTKLEDSEALSTAVQNGNNFSNDLTIPPSSIIKQLTAAYESVKNFRSIKDLLTSVEDPLPNKDKSSLSFSVVKSLVLREKEDKSFSDFSNDDEVLSMLQFLFDLENMYTQRKIGSEPACLPKASMPKDIRGAPPESFTVRLSEVVGSFKSLHKIASFWTSVVGELRKLWYEGLPVPWMPLDANPDLDSCLLHQQLQVINCCIARKQRRNAAVESLDSVIREASLEIYDSVDYTNNSVCMRYARLSSGDFVLRLGVDHISDNLMLETGEPIYSPVTQEGPILTEELIKETEELVLHIEIYLYTGERVHGHPGFSCDNAHAESIIGSWSAAYAHQIFLCSAVAIAETSISAESSLSKLYCECKEWVVATSQISISSENIGDICKVYETLETITTHPEEAITIIDQPEETQTPTEEPKNRFKRINLNFIGRDMNLLRKKASKEEKKSEEKQNVLSQIFEKKTSLFSKKQPKLKRASCSEPTLDLSDWTIL
ncbi:hypothetical protein AXF42_Ash019829 [Apostasia shenzhenica]|uniref:Uncharacterized protein n=1 Tax=Apostasia shenzhenica TaxID=1088818 RepID=A0A2I0ARE5_9ASPA|nr:hypothetical protein AXF42_Ash019829 [Apostasia shenzhenica]